MKNENHMKTNSQRIAIARAHLGYDDFDWLLWCDEEIVPVWEGRKLHGSNIAESKWHQVLDYLNDLNAMHEAEERLSREQWDTCMIFLGEIVREEKGRCHATAAQRAEAFLRTIGKWVEE